MLQPFELFKPIYLERLIKMKKIYLVTQSYTRGIDHFTENEQINILVSDYDDLNYAKVHYNAVKSDKYASIIYLENPQHKNKFDEMINGVKYVVYWCIVKSTEELEKRLDLKYKDHIRRFIKKNTKWRIGSDEKINPKFEVVFGELFLIIKYSSERIRVKFEEIEKS
ncbi:hypothetical protein GALL_103280 [mine drainage metagenome]|uniref:Uncharacterized protein n=1 Tax=mine drainage metagenome TaxID=410659 RepID=A0A1J5SGX0_9ZZZZ